MTCFWTSLLLVRCTVLVTCLTWKQMCVHNESLYTCFHVQTPIEQPATGHLCINIMVKFTSAWRLPRRATRSFPLSCQRWVTHSPVETANEDDNYEGGREEKWCHRVNNMEKKWNADRHEAGKDELDADKSRCNDTVLLVRHTNANEQLSTHNFHHHHRIQYTVYPPAAQIDSFKRQSIAASPRVMAFIQECSYYYHPWRFDMTIRSRQYHLTLKKSRVWRRCEIKAHINPKEKRDVFHFDFPSQDILKTIKSHNWKRIKTHCDAQ